MDNATKREYYKNILRDHLYKLANTEGRHITGPVEIASDIKTKRGFLNALFKESDGAQGFRKVLRVLRAQTAEKVLKLGNVHPDKLYERLGYGSRALMGVDLRTRCGTTISECYSTKRFCKVAPSSTQTILFRKYRSAIYRELREYGFKGAHHFATRKRAILEKLGVGPDTMRWAWNANCDQTQSEFINEQVVRYAAKWFCSKPTTIEETCRRFFYRTPFGLNAAAVNLTGKTFEELLDEYEK